MDANDSTGRCPPLARRAFTKYFDKLIQVTAAEESRGRASLLIWSISLVPTNPAACSTKEPYGEAIVAGF